MTSNEPIVLTYGDRVAQVIGSNIRALRAARGLKQADLGAAADCNGTWIGQIELGRTNARIQTLLAIARALDVEITDLLVGVEDVPLDEVRSATA